MNNIYKKIFLTLILILCPDIIHLFAGSMSNSFLAPKSNLSDTNDLFLEVCRNYYEARSQKRKINFLKSNKYRFSIKPPAEAWKNLLFVKNALGRPEEYRKPLTSESYDEITKTEVLLALARSFVEFFPAYDKYGKIKKINKKNLRILVESLKWDPERRRKAFMDKKRLENMTSEMEEASNPGTLGASWIHGVWRSHMILYKQNILNSRYHSNKILPLTVFLHELVHSLPGYSETMFNDTLAYAFMAFMGISNDDISILDSDENFMHLVSPETTVPFNYENLEKDISKLLEYTNWVSESGNRNPVRHTFLTAFSGWYSEPYLMNRHIGLYMGLRFSSILNNFLDISGIDRNTAYFLAKEDMLEALRITYGYLINSLASEYYFHQTGRKRPISVKPLKVSAEKKLYIAA